MLAKIESVSIVQALVCVFTNKRPSVAAKTSRAPKNVPGEAFRRACSHQAEKPVHSGDNIEPAVLPQSWTIGDLSTATGHTSSAVPTARPLMMVTMTHKNLESTHS